MIVYAVIVSFNPAMDTLEKCVQSVVPQVEKLLIIDNASHNQNEIIKLKNNMQFYGEKIEIICNKENLGVATALNIGLENSLNAGVDWLLTLDQDSVIPDGMISKYKSICKPMYGQLCCNLRNPNLPELTIDKMSPLTISIDKNETATNYCVYACITSGTLLNVTAAKKCGGFRDELFIDYVDYDISLNLLENGYPTLFVPNLCMVHSFGAAEEKNFLGYHFTDYNYAPIREYYKAKNCIYMIKRYPRFKKFFKKALLYDLICPLLGFRGKCVASFNKGFWEGVFTKAKV